jgi:hypothetical protein
VWHLRRALLTVDSSSARPEAGRLRVSSSVAKRSLASHP